MKKHFKQVISNRILDFIEKLPRFRGGTIASLQAIRERQREWSTKKITKRQAPDDASIALRQLTLVVTFEFEDFKQIQIGIKQLFPKNEKIQKFVESLKKKENDFQSLSWHNIGLIVKEKGSYIPDVEVIDDLPNNIEYVSLSYHRILPSVASIVFDFKVSEKISKHLNEIQNQEYLSPVVFKKLWPLTKIPLSYSMGGGESEAYAAILSELTSTKDDLKKWIRKNFKWRNPIINSASFVDVYEIKGNPTDTENLKKWMQDNHGWLADFGISDYGFGTYLSDQIIYSRGKSDDIFTGDADIVTKIQTSNESEFGDYFDFKVRSIAVSASLYSLIDKYRNSLEHLRAKGFKSLNNSNRGVLRKASSIQELKKLVTLINRIEHEVVQSKHWIIHSISEVGLLKESFQGNEINLGAIVADNIEYQIKQIKESAVIIDTGLTNYLSVQSIYVMYKLQKWMFILSIVVTVATIVGVISGWNNLKPIVEPIIEMLKNWINA